MKTHDSIEHDRRDRYLAKVNALIASDREDLVAEIIAEYVELTAPPDHGRAVGRRPSAD